MELRQRAGNLSGPITLDAVESYLPERVTTVEERAADLGLRPAQVKLFRKLHGLDQLRYDPEMSLFDLVLPPARAVLAKTEPAAVRYLLYVHSTQEVTPSQIDAAQVIRNRLGLEHACAFSVTQQNCATTLTAIDVAGALLRADGDPGARALVVSGEKTFTREVQLFFNAGILGEAAASCLVSVNGIGDIIHSYVGRTFGQYSDGIHMSPGQIREVTQDRPGMMRELLESSVSKAGRTLDDIHIIIPHNPNTSFWSETIREMGFSPGKVFLENIPRYSHCMTADVLVNYVTLRNEGRLTQGRDYLFVSTGLGMTLTAMTFTYRGV